MANKRLKINVSEISAEELLAQLIINLQVKKVVSKTIKNYEYFVPKFFNWFEGNISEIDNQTIIKYTEYLKDTGTSISTINTHLRHIRTILNFGFNKGYCKQVRIVLEPTKDNMKVGYTDEELHLLLKRPKRFDSFTELRDWTIINVFIATGLRRSSVVSMRVCDLDFQNGLINVYHTKNKKPLIIPMSSSLELVLKEYISKTKFTGDAILFPDAFGRPLRPDWLTGEIARYNHRRGVSKTSIHLFRHTYAKNMVKAGVDVLFLSRLLGHSDISMTQKYVNLMAVDLKANYDSICPLDKLSISKQKIKIG